MRGYSVVELLVTTALILVFSAMALPSLSRTLHVYQMDDAANQVANVLKLTRSQAIRRNTNPAVNPIRTVNINPTTIFNDNNFNGAWDPAESGVILTNAAIVAAGGVPATAALAANVGAGALTAAAPAGDNIGFDGRGASTFAGVKVFYVGTAPWGYRAVIILPSGNIQVWSYATGTWRLSS